MTTHDPVGAGRALISRVGARYCAIPIEHIEETLRPLPVEPLPAMPAFVLGVSVIRGRPIPVVHAGRLLGDPATTRPTRFVTLKTGQGNVALAVEAVTGVLDLGARPLHELPPLLREASADLVTAIGTLDSELFLLLRSARLVPESVWAMLKVEQP